MDRRVSYLVLAVLFVWTAAVEVRTATYLLKSNPVRSPFQIHFYSDVVASVRPEAASASVLERDRIVAIEGMPYTGTSVLGKPLQRLHPGDKLLLTVAPDEGVPHTKQVEIVLQRDNSTSISN